MNQRMLMTILLVACSDFELYKLESVESVAPDIRVAPPSLALAGRNEPVTDVVTIRNVGNAGLGIDRLVLEGIDSGSFSIFADHPRTLNREESMDVLVTFTPDRDVRDVTLGVLSNDPVNPWIQVPLRGMVETPQLLVDPPLHAFDEVGVNCADTQRFTLTNVGDAPLNLEGVTLDSEALALVEPLTVESLAPNVSTTVLVRFLPGADQAYAATMQINSDDPRGVTAVPLDGVGVEGLACLEDLVIDCDEGYQVDYYNHVVTHPDMEYNAQDAPAGDLPWDHDWFDETYFSFRRIEPHLAFGNDWFPVDEGLPGDPYHFAARASATLLAQEDAVVWFEMGSDDDGWAFIDGEPVGNLAGLHGLEVSNFSVSLSAGVHDLEIYMAERHTIQSGLWFRWLDPNIGIYACPE